MFKTFSGVAVSLTCLEDTFLQQAGASVVGGCCCRRRCRRPISTRRSQWPKPTRSQTGENVLPQLESPSGSKYANPSIRRLARLLAEKPDAISLSAPLASLWLEPLDRLVSLQAQLDVINRDQASQDPQWRERWQLAQRVMRLCSASSPSWLRELRWWTCNSPRRPHRWQRHPSLSNTPLAYSLK